VRDNTPFNGTLALLDGAGVVLVQVNDSGSTSSTTPGTGSFVIKTPNSPAEAIAYRIRSSGTYMARISTTSGTAGDCLLSIARNCRIGPATNLSVAVTDSPDPVPPGGQVVYTVTVSNTGSQAATFVTLRNDLPAGSALVSAAPSQGGCSGAGPVICPLGTLAAGTGAIVQITITAPGAPGAITHAARVTSMVLDSNPTDDLAQQVTTVGQADSDGDGTADADDCAPGDPSAWAVPDDATDLLFSGPGTSAIQWTAPAATGGSGLRYDLVRSVSGGDFSSIDCIATDQAGTSASDLGIPVNLYFYLVRAENACGGTLGASSGGTPHTAPSCP
jgi:uncharacterized repeat protein (TIGR01451 family)